MFKLYKLYKQTKVVLEEKARYHVLSSCVAIPAG